MIRTERRDFLRTAAVGALGLTLTSRSARAAEPSQRVVVGLVGAGGMGSGHLGLLAQRPDVQVAYVCDVDRNRLAAAARGSSPPRAKLPRP